MIGERIEDIINVKTKELLDQNKNVELPDDIIETDNLGEVIEKLSILHCRMWYLEDAISEAKSDEEIAELKRKIDICFKIKRPKYVTRKMKFCRYHQGQFKKYVTWGSLKCHVNFFHFFKL